MKKKNRNDILSNIMIYITILTSNIFFIRKIIDSDFYFDIRSAKDILTYGLDFKDHMSMFEGFKYLYHHWLYDLIIYPIFNIGGYRLVFICVLLLFFLFSSIIYTYISKKTNNKLIPLIGVIFLAYLIGKNYYPRVQTVSYLIILIQFILIEKLYTTGKIKYSILSIILSILMVNIHFPIWILIPIFYLPYIATIIIKIIKDKYKLKIFDNKILYEECNNNKMFIITFIIILLSSFISPYGLLTYTFSFKVQSYYETVYSNIGEMFHVNLIQTQYKPLIFILLFIVTLLSKKKIKSYQLFYLLGLGIFGFMYRRNLPYFYTYYIIICLVVLLDKFKLKEINFNVNKTVIIPIIIAMECLFIVGVFDAMNIKEYDYGISNGGEPIMMADYITTNLDYKNLKFYNNFSQGSYLAYRGIPTFVDSRVEVYLKEFNGKEDVMVDYFNEKPSVLIDKYKFDYLIVTPDMEIYDYLRENDYEEIYTEANYYHLFKNKEAN